MQKSVALNILWKGPLFTVRELKQESVALFDFSWDRACGATPILCCSVCVYKDHGSTAGTDSETTGEF